MFLEFNCIFFLYLCIFFLEQWPVAPVETGSFHVGDDVNILDPYDGAITGTERIQSLTNIHGVPLEETNANIVVLSISSNIPIAYEDLMDGFESLKETEKSFIRWPKIYLKKWPRWLFLWISLKHSVYFT